MGFRFQRRIRIALGVRLNLSKSGIGGSVGRTGLRLGVDAKRRKYFSVGLPGTGLSYRTFFGERVKPETVRMVGYIILVGVGLGVAVFVILAIQRG
jgi:Protein of unknown function (DUF4236)